MQNQTKGHDRPNFRFSVSALRNLTPLRGEASGNIEVCGHSFEIPLSKVAFISINAYMKLKDDPSAYKIDIQQKDDVNSVYNELTPEILISNFKGIVSIVDGAEASESEFYDQSAISYLSYQLRNVKMFCTTPIPTPHFPLGSPTLNLPFLLASISNLLDQDFAFVVGNYFFRLNKILARFISSAVTKLLSSNSLAREFTIQIPPNIPLEDFVMTFQLITQLLNGEDMEINEANFASVINIAGQLGNASLLFAALSVPEVELQKRLNAAAQFAHSSPKAPSEVIDFIADHFGDFQFEELNTLDAETLTSIIKSDCLRVENEDCLLSFCLHIYENDHSKGISILSCVKYECVSQGKMCIFQKSISFDDITQELWDSVCKRLIMKVECNTSKPNSVQEIDTVSSNQANSKWKWLPSSGNSINDANCICEYQESPQNKPQINDVAEHPYDESQKFIAFPICDKGAGVFAFLIDAQKKLDTKEPFALAQASSSVGNPNDALVWLHQKGWMSLNPKPQYFQVSFGCNSFILSGFSVLSRKKHFPKSFLVMGSNDLKQWEQIVSFGDENKIPINNEIATYRLSSSKAFNAFRILQTGNTPDGCGGCFGFRSIEFFGTLLAKTDSPLFHFIQ